MLRHSLGIAVAACVLSSACGDGGNVDRLAQEQLITPEVEPNGGIATATPLAGTDGVVRGHILPDNDVGVTITIADDDFYSFAATAGDRVYAATMTAASGGTAG